MKHGMNFVLIPMNVRVTMSKPCVQQQVISAFYVLVMYVISVFLELFPCSLWSRFSYGSF
uniref:Uncharacterized protein n=1 Tax=Anguilla anguilla TaxID=7936 RepID=A0A0E9T739_ANGAN